MRKKHIKILRNKYGQFLKNCTPWNTGKKRKSFCKIDGCNREHCALGFCNTHYYRLKRTGTTKNSVGNNEKISLSNQGLGEKHPAWKGDNIGYAALHEWVRQRLGRPNYCSDCGTTSAKKFEWANLSGRYKRDLKDFKRLCTSCHIKFDNKKEKK